MDDTGVPAADIVRRSDDVLMAWIEQASRELAARRKQHSLREEEAAPVPAPAAEPQPTPACSVAACQPNRASVVSHLWARGRYKLAGAAAFMMIGAVAVGLSLPVNQPSAKAVALQELSTNPPVVRTVAFAEAQAPSTEQEHTDLRLPSVEQAVPAEEASPRPVASPADKPANEPAREVNGAALDREPASERAGTSAPARNLSNPDQARAVQQRLAELGFFHVSTTGLWGPNSRQALAAFKAQAHLPADDVWDETTERHLFSADARGPTRFVGQWAPSPQACRPQLHRSGLLVATITEQGARAGGTTCTFQRKKQNGAALALVAACSDQQTRWVANVRLEVRGDRLTWSSERGSQSYVRCPENQPYVQLTR